MNTHAAAYLYRNRTLPAQAVESAELFGRPGRLREFRQALGMSQTDFWRAVGISQSGGSRYEGNSRKIPKPIAMLLVLAHARRRDAHRCLRRLREASGWR